MQTVFESISIRTSFAVIFKASQSILGRMFCKKERLYSMSDCSSSASLKCNGKERGEDLQALMAHVRKLTVRIFMVGYRCWLHIEVKRVSYLSVGLRTWHCVLHPACFDYFTYLNFAMSPLKSTSWGRCSAISST